MMAQDPRQPDGLAHRSCPTIRAVRGAACDEDVSAASRLRRRTAPGLPGEAHTREAELAVTAGAKPLPCIVGTPLNGEVFGAQTFDGRREVAIFPGDLPSDPDVALPSEGLAPLLE